LLSCVRDCLEDRSAAVALVTGPPGIGKSRLRDELLRRIVRELGAVHVWVGQGDAVTAGSPLSLLSRAVRRAIGIADGEPVHVRRQKLRARVERHASLGAETEHAVAFLGELAGVDDSATDPRSRSADHAELAPEVRAARHDPQLMTDQIRRALIGWLRAECAATPVVLVLEDLQWGDAPTVRLVDAALAELGDVPFMVLASARPEVHQVFPSLWSERGATEIRLSALPRRASEQLVREVLGDRAAPDVLARIVDLSSGNALYLEELIRAAAEGRDDAPPDSVVAMVQARLGRLPDDARHALRAASVFGDTFWRAGVAKLLGGIKRASGLTDLLAELERAEMIARAVETRFPGEDEYTFRHRLGREAAYATLAPPDRILGHRLAGEWLEDSGECDALTLAFHFELGERRDKAASWYASAAEQALERNDFASAVARTERGEACGAEKAVLGRLLRTRAEALGWLGQHADAYRTARAAVDILPRGTASSCEALADLIAAAGRLGKYDEVEALGRELEALPPTGEHASAALAALIRCAGYLSLAGRYAAADRLLARVGDIPDEVYDLDPLSGARLFVARGLRATGDDNPSAQLRWMGAAIDAYERLGDVRQANAQRINVAAALLQLGDYAGARRVSEGVVAAASRLGALPVKASALQNLGVARAFDGDLDGGLADIREAIALFESQGHVRQLSFSLVYLAQIQLLRREVDEARAAAARALETSPKKSPVGCLALGVAARTELAAGAPERALELVTNAAALLGELGTLEEGETDVRLAHAEILFATGDPAGATRAAGAARERILAKASRVLDQRLAASYVERVPANVRILALAKLWLGDP
jgi:tetratricopeptide (TPR) repeat protein